MVSVRARAASGSVRFRPPPTPPDRACRDTDCRAPARYGRPCNRWHRSPEFQAGGDGHGARSASHRPRLASRMSVNSTSIGWPALRIAIALSPVSASMTSEAGVGEFLYDQFTQQGFIFHHQHCRFVHARITHVTGYSCSRYGRNAGREFRRGFTWRRPVPISADRTGSRCRDRARCRSTRRRAIAAQSHRPG